MTIDLTSISMRRKLIKVRPDEEQAGQQWAQRQCQRRSARKHWLDEVLMVYTDYLRSSRESTVGSWEISTCRCKRLAICLEYTASFNANNARRNCRWNALQFLEIILAG